MITKHYKVAGHVFAVSGKAELFEQMGNYEPFECEGGEPLFSLTMDSSVVPEYTEVCYPIGGIVSLSQAPYNRIHRISGIKAYLTLYCRDIASFLGYPIAKDIDKGMHQTKDRLVQTIPMWHLECLPDEAAARLCHETIKR